MPERITLQSIWSNADLFGDTELSSDLVKFSTIAAKNVQDYIPKILKQEAYRLNKVFMTKQEKEVSKKIENCKIVEIRVKIISLVDGMNNKEALKKIVKNEIAGKTKDYQVSFYNTLVNIANEKKGIDEENEDGRLGETS